MAIEPGAAGTGVAVVPGGLPNAGSIVVSTTYQPSTGGTLFQVGRLTSSGALDSSFGGGFVTPNSFAGGGGSGGALAVAVVGSGANAGDVVAVGYEKVSATTCKGQEPVAVEYNPAGALLWTTTVDCTIYTPSGSPQFGLGQFNAVAVDPSGNIVAAGYADTNSGAQETLVARLTPSGSLDSSFGSNGAVLDTGGGAASVATSVAVVNPTANPGASDAGDVVTAGYTTASGAQSLSITALKTNGTADSSFAETGSVIDLIAGASSAASGLVALPNGNLAAAGSIVPAPPAPSSPTFLLVQYNPNGTPDGSFGSGGSVQGAPAVNGFEQLNSIAYEPFANLLVAAGIEGSGTSQEMVVAQYNASNGAVNSAFGSGGAAVTSFSPHPSSLVAVAVQNDGKSVAVGTAPVVNAVKGLGVIRVQGPQLSVTAPRTLSVTANGQVNLQFQASVDEPLPVPVVAVFCASAGATVASGSGCSGVNVPAGAQSISVPVTYTVNSSPGNASNVTLSSVSGNGLTGGTAAVASIQHLPPAPPYKGYWLVASDGGIFNYGTTRFFGSTGNINLVKPIVGMVPTPTGNGYWLVASDGGIFTFGRAGYFGSTGKLTLTKPIVGMARTFDGRGYWLVASDGGVFTFGDARYYGSTGRLHLAKPIIGMATTPDGRGYWLVASDGGIFTFGDARYFGSTGNIHLNKPIVGMAAYPGAGGYWLVASDGGIFTFGAARFHGSTGHLTLAKPIIGMAATPDGSGYWLVASDGGIFAFSAHFYGSAGGLALKKPIVGMAG